MSDKLVTLKKFTYSYEAMVLKSRLESEGIYCVLFDEGITGAHPFLSNAVGGIKLNIRETDTEHALKIVKEVEEKEKMQSEVPDEADNYFREEEAKKAKYDKIGAPMMWIWFLTLVIGSIIAIFAILFF